MPSALNTLIDRIADGQLRADVRAAVSDLRKVTDFGLGSRLVPGPLRSSRTQSDPPYIG
jgi:hypothetical protein